MEHDIRQYDIVLYVDQVFDNEMADINLSGVYNDYVGEKWLYADIPLHTTRTGNELISDEIIEKIIKPEAMRSKIGDDEKVLHKGELQLAYEEENALRKYLDGLQEACGKLHGTKGACVVTCNPFTKGHYHLIEYASKQVDVLYVFVVEEDEFLVPFEARMAMVCAGTKNLGNVVVLPSGKFIISKETFKNYFEKETCQDVTIDATKDTMIFRKYIVPELGISKRFVGEETRDNITKQYNYQLKKDLSGVIDVIEIPRKKVGDENISASRVRRSRKQRILSSAMIK